MNKAKYIIASVLSGAIAFSYIFYFINSIQGFVDLGSSGAQGGLVASTIVLSVISLLVAIAAFVILLVAVFKLTARTHTGNPISLFLLGLVFVSLEKVINSVGLMIIMQTYYPGVSLGGGTIVAMAFLAVSLILFVVSFALSKTKTKGVVGIAGLLGSIFFIIPLFMSLSGGAQALSLVYIVVLLISFIGVFGYFIFDAVTDFMSSPVLSPVKEDSEPVVSEKVESTYTNTNTEQALLRLKRLLDQGVISEEEYNEKRKKYVDSL